MYEPVKKIAEGMERTLLLMLEHNHSGPRKATLKETIRDDNSGEMVEVEITLTKIG